MEEEEFLERSQASAPLFLLLKCHSFALWARGLVAYFQRHSLRLTTVGYLYSS